jgi:hypothetical protein
MSLAPGTRLGAYEVLALIGAGGMGEVYRASDPRLGRDVAINGEVNGLPANAVDPLGFRTPRRRADSGAAARCGVIRAASATLIVLIWFSQTRSMAAGQSEINSCDFRNVY